MYVVFRYPRVKRLYLAVSITIAKFANTLPPCNLHKNRQIRQIRQQVRPISGDVIGRSEIQQGTGASFKF